MRENGIKWSNNDVEVAVHSSHTYSMASSSGASTFGLSYTSPDCLSERARAGGRVGERGKVNGRRDSGEREGGNG